MGLKLSKTALKHMVIAGTGGLPVPSVTFPVLASIPQRAVGPSVMVALSVRIAIRIKLWE